VELGAGAVRWSSVRLSLTVPACNLARGVRVSREEMGLEILLAIPEAAALEILPAIPEAADQEIPPAIPEVADQEIPPAIPEAADQEIPPVIPEVAALGAVADQAVR
jgi:hypothetical protein